MTSHFSKHFGGTFFFAESCAPSTASEVPRGQKLFGAPNFFHRILDCTLPFSSLCSHFSGVRASTSPTVYPLFPTVQALSWRPLRPWNIVSLFPYLKRFTHLLTILSPLYVSLHQFWSCAWIPQEETSSFALSQNKMSSSAILSHLQMTVCVVQSTWF
jgi:hypothetical protein